MKIAVLHGQSHQGSTWHITQQLLERLCSGTGATVQEFWFRGNSACVGCYLCFTKGEDACPHYDENRNTMRALEEADVIVAESPNYCMGMTGQMKVFMDHMAYRWMSHRPAKAMFGEVGVVLSTTAGAGAGSVTRELARQLRYWGVAKVIRLPVTVQAMGWEDVSSARRQKIATRLDSVAGQVLAQVGRAKPGLWTRIVFSLMRLNQKGSQWNPTDRQHWERQGWLEKTRPWK